MTSEHNARVPAPAGRATSAPVMGRDSEATIFEYSSPGRRAWSFRSTGLPEWDASELVAPAGRLVGRTRDVAGRNAYVTTLRAREQDIRREKASSNVCTNQTLIAVAAMIQLSWLGTSGLAELALRCARGARYTREALLGLPGVEEFATAATLREFALKLPVDATTVIERMAEEGFLAGVAVGVESGLATIDGEALLVSVTERRTKEQIDRYVECVGKVIR